MRTDTGTDTATLLAASPTTTTASTPSASAPISTWCWRSTTGWPRAVDDCVDITETIAALDPDPLRYMWVDEGDGQIPAQLAGGRRRAGPGSAAGRPHPRHGPGARRQPQRGPAQHRRRLGDHAGRLVGVGGGPRRPAARRAGRCRPRRWSRARRTCSGPPPPSPPTARRGCCSAARSTARSAVWACPVRRRRLDGAGAGQHHRRALVQPGGVRAPRRQPARVLAGPRRGTGSASSPAPVRRRRVGRAAVGERGRRRTTCGTRR